MYVCMYACMYTAVVSESILWMYACMYSAVVSLTAVVSESNRLISDAA